jgi:hypothetical protein
LSTFKVGDRIRVTSAFGGGPELIGKTGVVVPWSLEQLVASRYDLRVKFDQPGLALVSLFTSEVERIDQLVSMIHTEPMVSIDLSAMNNLYTAPFVITVEQATQLLRELDAVIL